VSCLQICLQFIPFYHLSIEYRSVFGRYLGVLTNLISLGIFLKCLEDASEEVCDADGVYVVLQNQRWGRDLRTDGRSLDHKLRSCIRWWAVCTVLSGQLQFGEGRASCLFCEGISGSCRDLLGTE